MLNYLKEQGCPNEHNFLALQDSIFINGQLLILTELLQEDIYAKFITRKKRMSLGQLQRMCRDVLQCLSFLKSRGVVHSDIKPENIAVSGDGFKVIDFGSAFFIDEASPKELQSLPYRSPEVILQSPVDF